MEYNLEEGVRAAVSRIVDKLIDSAEPIIVLVAGGSASGKTTQVAKKIHEAFANIAVIISMDDYYRGKAFMEAEARKGNVLTWDQPEALDLELLKNHLLGLKAGVPASKRIYSFKTGEPEGHEEILPHRLVILEGLFSLDDSLKSVGDLRIFVNIGAHGRILRRLLRDIERTNDKPRDIIDYFAGVVEPMHERYIQTTKKNAGLVISNEYNPAKEAERAGTHEVQLKFRSKLDPENLRKIGAERLGSFTQIDTYYNPSARNLKETGESLRIRLEGERRILTYKGPKCGGSEFRERPKFEFEIDEDIERKLLTMYGGMTKKISKERVLYQLDGAVFSVDLNVLTQSEGRDIALGNFIEVRSLGGGHGKDQLESALAKLGLKTGDGIQDSYLEMDDVPLCAN